MIKCIAIDMDGTLLSVNQKVSEENKQAIELAQKNGIEVIIATGRSYDEARFVLEDSGLSCPLICANGAEIRSKAGEILRTNPIPDVLAREIAITLLENNVYFEVYTNKGAYTNDVDKAISIIVDIFSTANPEIDVDLIIKGAEVRFNKGLIQKVNDYNELFLNPEFKIYKFLVFSIDPSPLAAAKKALEPLKGLVISSSGHENLEINVDQAEKGIALEYFLSLRNISLKETMAIGDNYNDLSMFKRVGKSVAMGNASEIIKMQCDMTTLSNEEHGVAKAIVEVINKGG